MRPNVVLLAALTLACAACGHVQSPTAPSIDMPASFSDEAAAAPGSIADLHWSGYFNDPELQQLIALALERNLDIAAAAGRIDQARGAFWQARSAALPQIGLTLSTSPGVLAPGDDLSSSFFGGVALSWELDFWGRYAAATRASRAALTASRADRNAVRASVVASVATLYFQLQSFDESIAITEDTVATQEESRRIVALLARQGVVSNLDLRQAETQLATTRGQLTGLRADAAATQHALSVLLGENPGARTFAPSAADMNVLATPAPPLGAPAALLTRRPDLVAAEWRLEAAGLRVIEARARFLPSISLSATAGRTVTEIEELIDSDTGVEVRSAGPAANQPVFTGGALVGGVIGARGARAQAEAGYRSAILVALREVADSLSAYTQSAERLQQAQAREAAAGDYERLARMRFRAGVSSYLEVLDAQRQFFAARIELAQARFKRRGQAVELYRALGGGWQENTN